MGVIFTSKIGQRRMTTYPAPKKTKHPQKGGKKGTRWMDLSQGKKKKPPVRAGCKGNMNKSNTQSPSRKEHIS
jgi:hypothetical protein